MLRRLRSAFDRRPVGTIGLAAIVAVVVVVLVGHAVAWARWELFTWRVDHASSVPASAPRVVASWSFAFGDRAVRLRVPIQRAELEAARGVDTRAMFDATGALRAHYVRHVVRAQSGSAFIEALSRQLRQVKGERGLDGDEHLELLVRAVQSLRYDTVERRVRLPVEVVESGFGVCSEKALLLAALMVHEGYQTAMWVFDSQNHVALGVGSDAAESRDSGYAFIETTRNAYVGEYDVAYLASGPVSRRPHFIELGGSRRFQAGAQVEYILRELSAAKQRSDALGKHARVTAARLGQRVVSDPALTTQALAARKLVRYIRGQTDERNAVFERLLRSAAESAARERPALIY